jgi:hypothetical protein
MRRYDGALSENYDMQSSNEGKTEPSTTQRNDDSDAPALTFGAKFGAVWGRDVEQLKRDAEAASLTRGAN